MRVQSWFHALPKPDRAGFLEGLGFSTFDALHLACAESGAADVFLTTGDGLLRD
jgi:hypothetical protein